MLGRALGRLRSNAKTERGKKMILIVGGTGNIGRHVVPALVERGEQVRVLSRDPENARGLLGEGVEIVEGDLMDPSSLAPALAGVEKAYLATNNDDQALMESNFIEAAGEARVRHIVKVSVVGATHDNFVVLARAHAAIEEKLSASGIPATILRPYWFMENFLGSADTIAGQGTIYGSAGDGKVAFVDSRYTAAIAVEALTGEGHEGKEYAISGPEALTFAEAAEKIGAGIGREVDYVDMPEEDFKGALTGAGLPEMVTELFTQIFRNARIGTFAGTTGTIEELTGCPARKLEDFARDHADALTGAAVSG